MLAKQEFNGFGSMGILRPHVACNPTQCVHARGTFGRKPRYRTRFAQVRRRPGKLLGSRRDGRGSGKGKALG